jgi:DNA-binding MurR/RpiR family transcriptional regulator
MPFHEWISKKAENMSPAGHMLAAHLVNHLEFWAFEPANRIAAHLGVHRSTIVRFAQALGLAGFHELQDQTRKALLKTFSPSTEIAISRGNPGEAEVERIFEREMGNLRETYQLLDIEALRSAADRLASARKVTSFGRRFSYPVALYLCFALRTMREMVRLAPDPGGSAIDCLFDLGREYLAVIVSLRRHSPEVRRVLGFLGDSRIPTVLLTDFSPGSAGLRGAIVIQAHLGSVSVLESYTALTSLCHTLLSLVHEMIPGGSVRLEDVERAWSRFNSLT